MHGLELGIPLRPSPAPSFGIPVEIAPVALAQEPPDWFCDSPASSASDIRIPESLFEELGSSKLAQRPMSEALHHPKDDVLQFNFPRD